MTRATDTEVKGPNMNKLLLIGAATALTLGLASAASAQSVTGVVNLNGSVPAQCGVVSGGSPPSGDFGNTVPLGTLVDSVGHLSTSLSGSTNQVGALGNFEINCTGAANSISIQETPLTGPGGTPPAGYANTVTFTAEADFATTSGTNPVVLTRTTAGTTSGALGSSVRLANQTNNVIIKAYSFSAGAANNILEYQSSPYTGSITVTIGAGT